MYRRRFQRFQKPQPPQQTGTETFRAFYHLACIGCWESVYPEQLNQFKECGLRPYTFVLGKPEEAALVAQDLPVLGHQANAGWFETPTLDELHKFCCANTNAKVLYCHGKGVSHPGDGKSELWRRKMMEHVVLPWREHLEKLEEFDTVGTYFASHHGQDHYAGNVWLARADYIARLPAPWAHRNEPRIGWFRRPRFHAECWLFSRPGARRFVVEKAFLE